MAAVRRSVGYGAVASGVLLALYFAVLAFVSGRNFAWSQFSEFWYFVVSLAIGFGAQVGLYQYLRALVHSGRGSGAVVGVTGTTSTAAMISCCTHYLVNVLPLLGAAGIVTLAAEYQVELFWVGLALNALGIIYIAHTISKLKHL